VGIEEWRVRKSTALPFMIHDDYDRSLAHSLSRTTLSYSFSRPETTATIKAHQVEEAMRGAEMQASLNNNS